MGVKLTEETALTLVQQRMFLEAIVDSAIKQGIIKDDALITRVEMVHHLAVCLGEAKNPRKKIVLFNEGIIYPNGKCAFLEVVGHPGVNAKDIKTSVPVTPYADGVEELSWFETINTIYIMAVGGKPVLDLRGKRKQEETEEE